MSKGVNAVIGILLDTSAVTDIVDDRIARNQIAQMDALPYIVIEEADTEPFPTKSGASSRDHILVNVFSYSANLSELDTLTEAVRAALDEKAAGLYNTVTIEQLRFQSQGDFKEEINNRTVFAVEQTYTVRVVR